MEELILRAINNDDEAFNQLILSIEKELYLVAKSRLKEDDDISDAIQETIFKCYKNIHKLKEKCLFNTWIIKILINECNKIYRKKRKYKFSLEDKEMDKYIGIEERFDENIDFYILIKNLAYEEKMILTLYYCSNYTTKEISKILSKKESTIRSKIARAKNKLREQYKGEEYGRY